MLANNNRAILRRLARNELRREWKRTAVLFMAIVVATVLLFGVLTTGVSYLSLARLQDTRLYGGEDDISVANGFTDEQYQQLVTDARVESVGQQAYAGFAHVNSPAFRESRRTSIFVIPHSRSGERTPSSRSARMPGRSPASSDALVPSRRTVYPSPLAAS